MAASVAANHEDCLTSLQSCFSTREIYSCIVDFFFFFRGGGAAAGRYKTAHRRRGKKLKKKKLWAAAANHNTRAYNEGD